MKIRDSRELPARLKELRAERGLSQYQLADCLGLSRGIIGNYEIGARQPDFATLRLIANFYGVSTDYLLGETDIRERLLTGNRREALAGIVENISALSVEDLDVLQGSLRCRDLFGEINSLSDDSLGDLKRYIELLRLRDTVPGGQKDRSVG